MKNDNIKTMEKDVKTIDMLKPKTRQALEENIKNNTPYSIILAMNNLLEKYYYGQNTFTINCIEFVAEVRKTIKQLKEEYKFINLETNKEIINYIKYIPLIFEDNGFNIITTYDNNITFQKRYEKQYAF